MPSNFSYLIPSVLAGSAMPGRTSALTEDLQELREKGIGAIITLTESALPAPHLAEQAMEYLHLPIPDFAAPTLAQLDEASRFIERNRYRKVPVLVHCHAGIGRTGTILAAYLITQGMSAKEAINKVRADRPGSIETLSQERVLEQFARSREKKADG